MQREWERSRVPHERDALQAIYEALQPERDAGLLKLYCNVELKDGARNSLTECDLLVLAPGYAAAVELKHFWGEIDLTGDPWVVNGRDESPHRNNRYKAQVFRSLLQDTDRAERHWPFVQSVVVLTHEESVIRGVTTPIGTRRGELHTFGRLRDFIAHVKAIVAEPASPGADPRAVAAVATQLERITATPPQAPHQVPGFEIARTLSQTETCDVYLAYRTDLFDRGARRLRVFKAIAADPTLRARQFRNFALTRDLPPHPFVVRSEGAEDGGRYIEATPWSDAGALRERIRGGRALPEADALRFGRQILEALAHLHAHGVIHRDLSPDSVVTTGETAQLTNFDLAFDPQADQTVLDDGERQKPSAYRAPEFAVAGADEKADIYAFGVLLYTMLVGHQAIKHATELRELGGELPAAKLDALPATAARAREVIRACVRLDAAARPTALQAIAILEGAPVAAPAPRRNEILDDGFRFDRYEIRALIGQGSTAQAYRAYRGQNPVVLKVFNVETPRDLCEHEEAMNDRAPVDAIARKVGSLTLPDGRQALAFADTGGKTLRAAIEAGERPDLASFKRVATNLLGALAGLHEEAVADDERKPLLHNDVNPSNVLLADNVVRLIDLGSASDPGEGPFRGTPLYSAPDLLVDGMARRQADGDLFAAAATLFEFLTGHRAFGDSLPGISAGPAWGALPAAAAAWKPWFARALSYDEAERFGSATEMLGAIPREAEAAAAAAPIMPLEIVVPLAVKAAVGPEPLAAVGAACGAAPFVAYLNGLQNVSANSANALAEAQARSPFFADVHVPVADVPESIIAHLTGARPGVVILSGHAGDGKSTIALDIFKRLRGLPADQPLDRPLGMTEVLTVGSRAVTIVKDLSEIEPAQRLPFFEDAFASDGSWLIVANTGPLLDTCVAYAEARNLPRDVVENEVLKLLEESLDAGLEPRHGSTIFGDKAFAVANLTRRDNVPLAMKILDRILEAPAWEACGGCAHLAACPIATNIRILKGSPLVRERVEWAYRRLSDYDRRITARQYTAHLAYALTAGLSCDEIRQPGREPGSFLAEHAFPDAFFGARGGTPSRAADALFVVRAFRDLELGATPVRAVDEAFERKPEQLGLPEPFAAIVRQRGARIPASVEPSRHRQSLRRLAYFLGEGEVVDEAFRSRFLRSPRLIAREQWFKRAPSQNQRLGQRDDTLGTILEEFTGFPAAHFAQNNHSLFVTLRREDGRFPQPVQLVLGRYSYHDFDLEIVASQRSVLLRCRRPDAKLDLGLPLLDYIELRRRGEVGEALDPIFRQRLSAFKAQLLNGRPPATGPDDPIDLLQAGIAGELRLCSIERQANKLAVQYSSH